MLKMLKKWHYFYPPIHILFLIVLINQAWSYIILVPKDISQGSIIFNATLTKLGENRAYSLNVHKNGYFVKKLLGVDRTTGEVFVKEKLDCKGIWYPNLFTLYIDSLLEVDEVSSECKNTRDNDFLNLVEAIKKGKEPNWMESREKGEHKSTTARVKYYSMPLRIFIYGSGCHGEDVTNSLLGGEKHYESLYVNDKHLLVNALQYNSTI